MLRGTRIGAVAGIVALAGVSGDAQAQQYSWNGIYVGGEAGGVGDEAIRPFLGTMHVHLIPMATPIQHVPTSTPISTTRADLAQLEFLVVWAD